MAAKARRKRKSESPEEAIANGHAKRLREQSGNDAGAEDAAADFFRDRATNPLGRIPEAGVIQKIYMENFMCHRKLSVDLCRNVNFINGQNGSGKSAILAAIQICLGAGARRTHRARNLKELVRKDSNCSCARVRVTLLNNGADGYKQDEYGASITVERTIALRGGFNGYKLLDENLQEKSRSKKDLDEMLDKLNIQVENPVAILDQEEAKKFLCGKAEDKYAFFMKATELERMDCAYASGTDYAVELQEQVDRMQRGIGTSKEVVEKAKREWEKHQEIKKLKDKLEILFETVAWSYFNAYDKEHKDDLERTKTFKAKAEQKQLELSQAEEAANGPDDEEAAKRSKLDALIQEASDQTRLKEKLEGELKEVLEPHKKKERDLQRLRREQDNATKRVEKAQARLQKVRAEIIEKTGSAESEAVRRTELLKTSEEALEKARSQQDKLKQAVTDSYNAYEEISPLVEQARTNTSAAEARVHAIHSKIRDLESSSGNSLAVFGPKCSRVREQVDRCEKAGKFRGPVLGPIGAHIKIVSGKEQFASLAELALGNGVLDRFIVTNDHDRKVFQEIRERVGCHSECGYFQVHASSRFNIPPPPDGVETVASVLNIEDEIVFNCLVDNCRIDDRALATSREESERILLAQDAQGNFSIRGHIKTVFCLPNGDNWSVMNGSVAIVGHDRPLRSTIGVDRSAALAEAKREAEGAQAEQRELNNEAKRLDHEHTRCQKDWNAKKRAHRSNSEEIDNLLAKIDQIKAQNELAANFETDTTEQEQDVADAQQRVESLKEQVANAARDLEEDKPKIQEARSKLDEVKSRNKKVLEDMKAAEDDLAKYIENMTQRQERLAKKREKVKQYQTIIAKHEEKLRDSSTRRDKALDQARKLAFQNQWRDAHKDDEDSQTLSQDMSIPEPTKEELDTIEPFETEKEPSYYEARIERARKKLEQERQRQEMNRDDPDVAYRKFVRAKQDLNSKVEKIEKVKIVLKDLKDDLKSRRKRWLQFRKHISNNTDAKFDEILNLKGSSGELDFDHENCTLGLVVQKDSKDENSQQKDVKALSGGERSYTTMALLLALGEMLETPFRILDEFDVFLDPVTRKLTIDNLIEVAKGMEHRQFIFITPQDISNVKPDPMLKILKLHPPERNDIAGGLSQQTLPFSQS